MEQTVQIPNFDVRKIEESVLWGVKDYVVNYILPPQYRAIKDDAQGGDATTRTGNPNEIEVRVSWRGKPRVVPFLIVDVASNFTETRSNFDADGLMDEVVTSVGGVKVALRDRGGFGEMTCRLTIGADDTDRRMRISDWLISGFMLNRGAFVYRAPDGMGRFVLSFSGKAFKVGEPKQLGMNNNAEYLYFQDVDVPIFAEFHMIEQVFPGVVTSTGYVGTVTS